jgi:hypothetical protein
MELLEVLIYHIVTVTVSVVLTGNRGVYSTADTIDENNEDRIA